MNVIDYYARLEIISEDRVNFHFEGYVKLSHWCFDVSNRTHIDSFIKIHLNQSLIDSFIHSNERTNERTAYFRLNMVSCGMCMQSVAINFIILIWSLMIDAFFINENRGIKSGLVYCELESWILPAYSFFTSIGILIACVQLTLLIFCCGCLKPKECLRVRSYTIDLFWAIAKEVPQIMIILHLNLCRDGWFKLSSLLKAIFSICVTIWKLYNLYNFLRNDVNSEDIPLWCRAKRLYFCFPIFLIPVWIVNLALSVMIAILFVHRHHRSADIRIPGSIRSLHIHDEYLYTKYIVRSGIYVNWPEEGFNDAFIKLAEIDSIMANARTRVDLHFHLPYVCLQRTLTHEKVNRCYFFNHQNQHLTEIDENEIPSNSLTQSFSFNFRYKQPSNMYNLGQITYQGNHTAGSLYLNRLLYFRLHHSHHRGEDNDDFFSRSTNNTFNFYWNNRQLIPIVKAWRYGVGRCRPCVFGPQLILGLN